MRFPRQWVRGWKARLGLAAVLLFFVIPAIVYLGVIWHGERELRKAIADTDAADPRWRYEQILEDQPPIPDEQNSAFRILEAHRLLPPNWLPRRQAPLGKTVFLSTEVVTTPTNRKLDPRVALWLRNELSKLDNAVRVARVVADMPRGRFPARQEESNPAAAPHLEALDVAKLLNLDAYRLAEEGDLAGALRSARAEVNAGRAMDEPGLLPLLARIAIPQLAVLPIERALALGEPPENALAEAQSLLAEELRQPWLTSFFRFQRAEFHRYAQRSEPPDPGFRIKLGFRARLEVWMDYAFRKQAQAQVLRSDLRAIGMVAGPFEQVVPKLPQVKAEMQQGGWAARHVQLRYFQAAEDICTDLTRLHCAAVGLAVERYRLAHGHWPDSLDALVPDFLPAVPLDPFDQKPLRYLDWDEGVVVYSVMRDGVDRVAASPRDAAGVRKNIGFRLWDVEQRGLPALP